MAPLPAKAMKSVLFCHPSISEVVWGYTPETGQLLVSGSSIIGLIFRAFEAVKH